MNKDKRKEEAVLMAERVMGINNTACQSMIMFAMAAYAEGKAAGKAEERKSRSQEQLEQATSN